LDVSPDFFGKRAEPLYAKGVIESGYDERKEKKFFD
jgi:hypothetical protein